MTEDQTAKIQAPNFSSYASKKNRPPRLVQISGAEMGRRYPLEGEAVVIGRSAAADILIKQASVSRHHAVITMRRNAYELEDMGSSNGTFINATRIQSPTLLKEGDIVGIGAVLFRFLVHDHVDTLMDRIYDKATVDQGTGLYNRSHLLERLENEYAFSTTYGRDLSLLFIDLDKFKMVNDTHGHHNGDRVLKQMGDLVLKWCREYDIPGRFGGEEFVVLLPNTALEDAVKLGESLRAKVAAHSFSLIRDKTTFTHRQTISIGAAQYNSDMEKTKDLLVAADKCLYRAKSEGRDRVCA